MLYPRSSNRDQIQMFVYNCKKARKNELKYIEHQTMFGSRKVAEVEGGVYPGVRPEKKTFAGKNHLFLQSMM